MERLISIEIAGAGVAGVAGVAEVAEVERANVIGTKQKMHDVSDMFDFEDRPKGVGVSGGTVTVTRTSNCDPQSSS